MFEGAAADRFLAEEEVGRG